MAKRLSENYYIYFENDVNGKCGVSENLLKGLFLLAFRCF